jgi:hypothetical protein
MRGFHVLLTKKPSFLLMLFGWSSIDLFPDDTVHVSTFWPEYWCCVGPGLCCVQLWQTSQDARDGYVVDVP